MTFSSTAQDAIAELYLETLNESGDETTIKVAALLKEKLKVVKGPYAGVETFVQKGMDPSLFLKFAELDAKLIDVQWRARKVAGIMALKVLTEHGGVRNGDRFLEVIDRLKSCNLSPAQVQELVNDAFVWPSLTTHPTNPTSLAFTQAGLALDKVLADPNSSRDTVKAAIRDLVAVSMDEQLNKQGARRKTPQMEADELIEILSVLYNSVNAPRHELRKALDFHGYSEVNTRALLDIHVWGPGDGDGNPNMDAAVLSKFLKQLRTRLCRLYIDDLKVVAAAVQSVPESMSVHDMIRTLTKIATDEAVRVGAALAEEESAMHGVFDRLQKEVLPQISQSPEAKAAAVDLLQKYETFGVAFAKVDIRHNSRDIMCTVGRLLELCDALPEKGFAAMSDEQQANLLRSRLQDPSMVSRVVKTYLSHHGTLFKEVGPKGPSAAVAETDPKGVIATRVFKRMMVAGANPGRFQKFIIAETTSIANVLGALLLLKAGGVKVMLPGSHVDVVPLFESRTDLRHAPQMIHELLTDPSFSANCAARGYLLAMIAKSDTARLSGAGVQGAQEETIGTMLAAHPSNYGGHRLCVMLGGGDDQMRGGGRIVESPHVVMRAQAREGGCTPSRIAMTLQGMQLQLIFGSTVLAGHFIEGFSAQMLLANARVSGKVPWRRPSKGINEIAAAKQTHKFFEYCMNGYEAAIGSEADGDPVRRTVVDYLNGYPKEIIEWTNKSSRPGARQKTDDPLQGRAISLDQLAKHDGAYMTATLGAPYALEALSNQLQCGRFDMKDGQPATNGMGMAAHWHAYGNKAFRDFIRLQATVLFQKDYTMAWKIRGGVPGYLERQQLEAAWVEKGYNPPRVFLAHLEKLDHKEAFFIAEIIARRRMDGPVGLKDPLLMGWPELAQQLDARERQSRVAKRLELKAIRRINMAKITARAQGNDVGEISYPADLRTLAFYAYVGVNPSWSSPNFSLTMTDPTKDDGQKLLSEKNPAIQAHLPKLAWAKVSDAAATVPAKL